jgi:hypothetical protein
MRDEFNYSRKLTEYPQPPSISEQIECVKRMISDFQSIHLLLTNHGNGIAPRELETMRAVLATLERIMT